MKIELEEVRRHYMELKDAFELACAERATISGDEQGFRDLFTQLARSPERSSQLEKYRVISRRVYLGIKRETT